MAAQPAFDKPTPAQKPPPAGESIDTASPQQEKPRWRLRWSTAAPAPAGRLTSLDAFRGLTIFGMLLVNNVALGEATPRQLTHAPWNGGVHFADLVFPWFLLIVGVAIPFSAASHRKKGLPAWRYDLRALGRAVTLVLLGCLIASSQLQRPVFMLGVLQLIGLSYLGAALLYDLPLPRRLLVAGALLVAHWAAIRFVPVPGIGAGVFTESRNLIQHVNQVYLEPIHLRGLLSAAPMTALVLIGTAFGDLLRAQESGWRQKLARLAGSGMGLVAIGWLWSLDLPFNKPVWTASYILFTAGAGILTLAMLYLLVDVAGGGALAFPLVVFGTNALLAYVAPILVKLFILQPWKWPMADGSLVPLQQALLHGCITLAGRVGGGWLYTGGYILFWWLVLLWLYRKGVFWRV